MKIPSRRCRAFYLIVFIAVLAACSTTKPTAEWRDRSYSGKAFDNILIVGIAAKVTARRAFENTFVDRLNDENIKATAGFAVMPEHAQPTEANIKAVIEDIHFDGVMVTHLVGVDENTEYHPGVYRDSFYGYYGHVGGYVYQPGYYTRHKWVRLETKLYDARTEKLVWSMQTETMDPSTDQKLIDSKIKTVVKRLKGQGLLQTN